MTTKCDGQRKSLTVQLNSRPVRRIELIRTFVLCEQITSGGVNKWQCKEVVSKNAIL